MSKTTRELLNDYSIVTPSAASIISIAGAFDTSSAIQRMTRLKANQSLIHAMITHTNLPRLKKESEKGKYKLLSASHSGAMKPTLSSIRDYTSKLTHYVIALGLTTGDEYVEALLDPYDFGAVVDGVRHVGLHEKAATLLYALVRDWYLDQYGHEFETSLEGYYAITEDFMEKWRLETTAPIASLPTPIPEPIEEEFPDPLGILSGLPTTTVTTEPVSIPFDGGEITSVSSWTPAVDCSGFDLRETLNVFAMTYDSSNDVDFDLLFEKMRMLQGINKGFVNSIEKLSKNDEALSKLRVDTDKVSDTELAASVELLKLIDGVTTTTTEVETMTVATSKYDAAKIDTTMLSIINSAMSSSKMGSFEQLCDEINGSINENAELTDALAKARTAAAIVKMAPVSIDASSDGVIPKGETLTRKVIDILDELGMDIPVAERGRFAFEVPYFVWESEHPHVPKFDTDYQWRWDILLKIIWGITKNMKPWVHGHTGTGKTTLVEQACAILKWPFARINFDSEITRMDLIGNAGLETDEHGNTITKFVEGILPQMLAQPYVICGDEFDFVRSDIAYVFQRALEDKGLLLTEDAGRLVQPHPYSRIIATANTQGQGDEFGLYQGARVQSQAFLDRFQCWIEVPYLDSDKEKALVSAKVPSLPEAMVDKIIKYVCEHREAFKQAAILKPMSPRGVVSLASAISDFTSYEKHEADGVRLALESTILGSVTHADASKINELVDRTFN